MSDRASRRRVRMFAFLCSALMLVGASGIAQNTPALDVASVKRNNRELGPSNLPSIRPNPYGVTAVNYPLEGLVVFAFGISPIDLQGVPGWARTARFDIEARATGAVRPEQTRDLMRQVLSMRFGLRTHTDVTQRNVYEVSLLRANAALGPNIRPALTSEGFDSVPEVLHGLPIRPTTERCLMTPTTTGIAGSAVTMAQVLSVLAALGAQFGGIDDLRLIDRTGMAGRFDMRFDFSPADALAAQQAPAGATPGSSDPAGSTAAFRQQVEEQLGLRITTRIAEVDTVVIDAIGLPESN